MPRVVVATDLGDALRLLDGLEVVFAGGDVAAALADADGAIVPLTVRVDEELLARAPRLRIVANVAVGVNNIDLVATRARNVLVTNTPDVLTDATADLALGLLLASARRFREGNQLVSTGKWIGWRPGELLGQAVAGRALGVIGLGRIGRAVATRARGFAMRILYSGPRRAPPEVERALDATHLPLDELLARSDFVSIHCPLTDGTRHSIGARELALMKPRAILVNTARGPIVDEAALAEALAAGRIAAVGLDVFEDEPRVHPSLMAHPRALLLPHLGSATVEARAAMAELAAAGVADFFAGRRPRHVVG